MAYSREKAPKEEINKFGVKVVRTEETETRKVNKYEEIKLRNLPSDIKYCQLNLSDSSSADISKYFEQAFSFIELARKKKSKNINSL